MEQRGAWGDHVAPRTAYDRRAFCFKFGVGTGSNSPTAGFHQQRSAASPDSYSPALCRASITIRHFAVQMNHLSAAPPSLPATRRNISPYRSL
jgi:hypothetical protein